MSDLVEGIRSLCHWDVAIRPDTYEAERVPYADLEALVARSTVRMRGWPVPMIITRTPIAHGPQWVGQEIDALPLPHLEAWRMFTSGQFTQLRVTSADARSAAQGADPPIVEVWEILFYLTELVELAARFALSPAGGGGGTTLDVALRNTTGRRLVAGTPERELHDDHVCQQANIELSKTFPQAELIGGPRDIAVDLAARMMRPFGFDASPQVLADYQRELTERH